LRSLARCWWQGNCREAFMSELQRRIDRMRRWVRPRPPVRRIPIEPGDLCAFCHEELSSPPPGASDADELGLMGRVGARGVRAAHRLSAVLADACARVRRRWRRGGAADGDGGDEAEHAAGSGGERGAALAGSGGEAADLPFVLHCRWGCGKAVHRACAEGWGRDACVYCSAPMH
jgi:hypothetical protein